MAHRPMLLLVMGALAFPAVAPAADTTAAGSLTITESKDPNETTKTINADECNGTDPDGNAVTDNLTFNWTFTSTIDSSDAVRIAVSNTTGCPTTNASNNIYTVSSFIDSVSNPTATDQWPRSGQSQNNVSAGSIVQALSGTGSGISCSSTNTTTLFVCVVDDTKSLSATGSIVLNTRAPSAPTGVTVESSDAGLYLSWTAVSGSSITYKARATAVDTTQDGATHDSDVFSGTSGRISGLTNGVTYSVVVFAFSSVGNRSAASAAATGTPAPTDDPWDRYRQAGGVEQGGCSAGSAGTLAPLLLLLPLWRRRRP